MSALAKIHQPHESKWYAVPPCNGRGWNVPDWERSWHVVDEHGELVATFEAREDCEAAVQAYNARIEQ